MNKIVIKNYLTCFMKILNGNMLKVPQNFLKN